MLTFGPGAWWFYPTIGAAGLVAAAALFMFARWDFGRAEEWAREA